MHRATWGYTNIALLTPRRQVRSRVAPADERLVRLAYWDWEEWRNHTARSGLNLRVVTSHTYTTVQIDALAMMLSYSRLSPVFRQEVRGVLRQILTQSMLDFHLGIGRSRGRSPRLRAGPEVEAPFVYGPHPLSALRRSVVPVGDLLPPLARREISEATFCRPARTWPCRAPTVQASDFLDARITCRPTTLWAASDAHALTAQRFLSPDLQSETPRCGWPLSPTARPRGIGRQARGNLLAAHYLISTGRPPPREHELNRPFERASNKSAGHAE